MAGAEFSSRPAVVAAINPGMTGPVGTTVLAAPPPEVEGAAQATETAAAGGVAAGGVRLATATSLPQPGSAVAAGAPLHPTTDQAPPVVAAAVGAPLRYATALSLPATPPPPRTAVTEPPAESAKPLPRAGTLVRWECAAALAAAGLTQPWPVTAAAALAAAVTGGSTLKIKNRSLAELTSLGLGYLARPRDVALPPHERAAALLEHLLPGVSVGATDLAGVPVLVVRHAGGVAAVAEPTTSGPRWVPPATLLPAADPDGPYPGVQAIFHAGGGPGTPPRRWFGIHAVRTAGHADDDVLTLVLRNTLRRVLRGLTQHGVPSEPLGREAGLATIAALAHVTGGRTVLREDWTRWRTGPISQICFRVDGPVTERLVAGLLSRPPGVAVTLAAQARRTPRGTTTSATLRLAARSPAALDAALPGLTRWCAGHGRRLDRLDGHHLTGVTATLPIGGTAE
ncbi:hypothetical protein OHS18_12290 [Amycolatopsis sp. NBC_00355]|uniref:hypothetical protein n=1 Tax=Amycolatopsis sp. NBC_00355 TaxID=2975957 RepID=UPI002E276270